MSDAFLSRLDGADAVDAAEEYLLAGGVVTWDWWAGLTEDSRDAFVEARRRVSVAEAEGLILKLMEAIGAALERLQLEGMAEKAKL